MTPKYRDAINNVRKAIRESDLHSQLARLQEQALEAAPVRSLIEALSEDSLALIVEPKRATAQRGVVNPQLNVADAARISEQGGAAALSIVTEHQLSQGSISDLIAARNACEIPILARDFVVSVAQVYQLRVAGADAIFVPVIAFEDEDDFANPDERLDAIVESALDLGMDVVLSVRSEEELERALQSHVEIINIDNRQSSEAIDVARTFDLLANVPVGTTVISESVANGDEVARLHRAGVDALLLDEGHVEGDLQQALAYFSSLSATH